MDFQREIKKRKCHNEEEDEHQPLKCLPHEIALDILSRLPIKSVIQSRFACRSWNLLSRDLHLVNMHMSRALICQRLCLIFHSDYPIRNQLHFVEFSDVDDNEIVRKIDTPFVGSSPEFSVIGSCNGLLCLVDSLLADSIYIYNPFTRDYKVLPKSVEFENQIVIHGFGFHPVTKEYKVIKIVYYPNTYNLEIPRHFRRLTFRSSRKSDVQIFNLGNNEWRSIGEAPYRLEKRSSPPGILVSGRLHWMSQRGNYNGRRERIIVSFDLVDDSFQEIPRPDTGTLRSWANDHLAVLGGCLSAAVPSSLGNGALDIWVMKEYGVKDSWVKDFTLGAYSPTLILAELREPYWIWKSFLGRRFVQIICLLKNGDILVEYRGTLASYNPDSGIFKEVSFQGMPRLFQTTVHIGSLNPVQS